MLHYLHWQQKIWLECRWICAIIWDPTAPPEERTKATINSIAADSGTTSKQAHTNRTKSAAMHEPIYHDGPASPELLTSISQPRSESRDLIMMMRNDKYISSQQHRTTCLERMQVFNATLIRWYNFCNRNCQCFHQRIYWLRRMFPLSIANIFNVEIDFYEG